MSKHEFTCASFEDDDGDGFIVIAVENGDLLSDSQRATSAIATLQKAIHKPVVLYHRNRTGVTVYGAPPLRRVVLRADDDNISWRTLTVSDPSYARDLWDRTNFLSLGDLFPSWFK